MDTILKALSQIKGKYSVERSEKDNININILGFNTSFELRECKTKRRYRKRRFGLIRKRLRNIRNEKQRNKRVKMLW